MAVLYLAKVNLNSRIFDVYESRLSFDKVFEQILLRFREGEEYLELSKEKYSDSFGNTIDFNRKSIYTLHEVQKNEDRIITGKIIRTFNRPSEIWNDKANKVVPTMVEESVSINFYYDVCREMITFCERQSFGYNQFMKAFSYMLNKSVGEYEFEIFLEKDRGVLMEKLSALKTVERVSAVLIPPNSNEEDLAELRENLVYMKDCQEANATRVSMEYVSEKMQMESRVMQDIISAVSRGYGDMTSVGINASGRKQRISSSQDAAFTSDIQNNIGEFDFREESKNLILRFIASKLNKAQ